MTAQNDAGDSSTFGGSENSTEILWVGHAVEHDEERLRIGDQSIEVGLGERSGPCDDALVGVGDRLRSKVATADLTESDAEFVGQPLDVDKDVRGRQILDHQDLPDRTLARQQQLPNGLTALDLITAEAFAPAPATPATAAIVTTVAANGTINRRPLPAAGPSTAGTRPTSTGPAPGRRTAARRLLG